MCGEERNYFMGALVGVLAMPMTDVESYGFQFGHYVSR